MTKTMRRGRMENLKLLIVTLSLVCNFGTSAATLDIAEILDAYPEFSLLNQLLTLTGVADEINRKTGLTLFAPPNNVLSSLQASVSTSMMGDILRHHVATEFLDFTELQFLTSDQSVSTLLQSADSDVVVISSNEMGAVIKNTIETNVVRNITQIEKEISILKIDQVLRPLSFAALPPTTSDSQILEPLNVTRTLETLDQFSIFEEYLKVTGVDTLLNGLQGSEAGCTIFAPTDEAFNSLPGNWFQKMSKNDQRLFLEYHSLSKYFSLGDLWKLVHFPAETVASTLTKAGSYGLQINSTKGMVKIRAGISTAMITSTLYQSEPIIIFAIDSVLLPRELFPDGFAFAPSSSDPPVESPAAPPSNSSTSPAPDAAGSPPDPTPTPPRAPAPEKSGGGRRRPTGTDFVSATMAFMVCLLLSSSLFLNVS